MLAFFPASCLFDFSSWFQFRIRFPLLVLDPYRVLALDQHHIRGNTTPDVTGRRNAQRQGDSRCSFHVRLGSARWLDIGDIVVVAFVELAAIVAIDVCWTRFFWCRIDGQICPNCWKRRRKDATRASPYFQADRSWTDGLDRQVSPPNSHVR